MKWIQQSFIFLVRHPRESLILAIISLATLYVSMLLHFAGVILASFCFVFVQAGIFRSLLTSEGQQIDLTKILAREEMAPLILASLLYIPTNIMMGTIVGLFQGSSSPALGFVMIGVFAILCSLCYILVAHTTGFIVQKKIAFIPALELAAAGFGKNRRNLFLLGVYSAFILLISAAPMGLGLILTLPLHFYIYYFSFNELYAKPATEEVP